MAKITQEKVINTMTHVGGLLELGIQMVPVFAALIASFKSQKKVVEVPTAKEPDPVI